MKECKFVVYFDGEEQESFSYTDDESADVAYNKAVDVFVNLEKECSKYEAHEILLYDEHYYGSRLTFKELHMETDIELDEELLNSLIDEEHRDRAVHSFIEDGFLMSRGRI